MALKHKIEWDPEEVAAGYNFSSIYEGVDENTTVPAYHITDQEVMDHVVKMAVNTTINPTTMTPTTVASPSSSAPSTISTVMKKVVEHLGREPSSPVATVCILFFKHSIKYITVLHSTLCTVHYRTVFYILHPTVYNTVQFVL